MPLKPGTTFAYKRRSDGTSTREKFVVTDRTKTILDVKARVIRDTNWEGGQMVEQTEDWFAQDGAGNVMKHRGKSMTIGGVSEEGLEASPARYQAIACFQAGPIALLRDRDFGVRR